MKLFGVEDKTGTLRRGRFEYNLDVDRQIDECTVYEWIDLGEFIDNHQDNVQVRIEFNRRYKGGGCRVYIEKCKSIDRSKYNVFMYFSDDRTGIKVHNLVNIEKEGDDGITDIVKITDDLFDPDTAPQTVTLCKCLTILTTGV